MTALTEFDRPQLMIMVCNTLIKSAENSPEPNRSIRLTNNDVREFADSDSKRKGGSSS